MTISHDKKEGLFWILLANFINFGRKHAIVQQNLPDTVCFTVWKRNENAPEIQETVFTSLSVSTILMSKNVNKTGENGKNP